MCRWWKAHIIANKTCTRSTNGNEFAQGVFESYVNFLYIPLGVLVERLISRHMRVAYQDS